MHGVSVESSWGTFSSNDLSLVSKYCRRKHDAIPGTDNVHSEKYCVAGSSPLADSLVWSASLLLEVFCQCSSSIEMLYTGVPKKHCSRVVFSVYSAFYYCDDIVRCVDKDKNQTTHATCKKCPISNSQAYMLRRVSNKWHLP